MNIYSFKRISRSSVLFRPQPTKVTKRTKFTFATKVCLYEPFRRSCTVTAGRRSGLNLGSSSGNSYCNSYIDCEESGNGKRREKNIPVLSLALWNSTKSLFCSFPYVSWSREQSLTQKHITLLYASVDINLWLPLALESCSDASKLIRVHESQLSWVTIEL